MTKTSCELTLGHTHILSQAWTFYFLLNSAGPPKTCNQGSSRHWQLDLGLPPDPVSKVPFSLTSQWARNSPALANFFSIRFLMSQSRAPPRLSLVSSILSPSFVLLSPALINTFKIFPTQSQEPTHYRLVWGRPASSWALSRNMLTQNKDLYEYIWNTTDECTRPMRHL